MERGSTWPVHEESKEKEVRLKKKKKKTEYRAYREKRNEMKKKKKEREREKSTWLKEMPPLCQVEGNFLVFNHPFSLVSSAHLPAIFSNVKVR